jgi:hypothetical protein
MRRQKAAFLDQSLSRVTREPSKLFVLGLAMTICSGALMFLTGPKHYFYNGAFDLKMPLLLLAVTPQPLLFRQFVNSPIATRLSVALSLAFWFGVAIARRAIAFV